MITRLPVPEAQVFFFFFFFVVVAGPDPQKLVRFQVLDWMMFTKTYYCVGSENGGMSQEMSSQCQTMPQSGFSVLFASLDT